MAKKDYKAAKIVYTFLFIALFCAISLAVNGDINNDSKVNFNDLSIMAENWLDSCSSPSWCNGADINTDNVVNMEDYAMLAKNWGTDSGLVGWWKMEGPIPGQNVRIVKDYSGYGNNGTMGSSDAWITGGGINFDGGYDGASGIRFVNTGADLIADMALSSAVTVSYKGTWGGLTNYEGRFTGKGAQYPFDGRASDGTTRLLSSETPTGNHLLNHIGGYGAWGWEAFNSADARFIFAKNGLGKTWGDMITITMTADFTAGAYKLYVDGQLYVSETVPTTNSFANLAKFTLGTNTVNTYSCMEGNMKDFRIYNRALDPQEIAELCVEVPATSWNHSPADGNIAAVTSDFDLTLRWSAGKYAISHDVYLGTSFSSVENATHSSPEYKGNLSKYTTNYDLTSLDPNLIYYWRIDEIGTGRIDTGQTLSFSVSDVWLYTFHNNVGDLDSDERICAYAIQGFANKTEAKLFLDTKGGNPVNITADEYWINYLQTNKGYRFGIINNLRELIQLAKTSGFVNGLVLYDPYTLDNAGELMPALNIASTQNRLPVTANMLAYTSKEIQNYGSARCFDGMNTVDIRGSWATHLAAQTDYVTNHLAGTPKTGVCKVSQNFTNFNDIHNFNYGLDYGIIKGYFIMDMNPGVTSEKILFNTVMDYLTKPAMTFGSWHDEGADVGSTSEKGHYNVLGTANLSFWAHVPANPNNLWLRKSTTGKTLDPNKYYVMIQASDGDAMPHETGLKPSLWEGLGNWLDPIRGTTPMTWTCQPLSATLWPAITEYYATTSTSNDTFCTGPSGAGYCIPGMMSAADQATFAAFEEPFLHLTGLQWVEQWGPMGESMWNTMKANAPSIKCFGHQGTPGGINNWLDDGTPVAISEGNNLWHPFLSPTNPADPYNISDPNNIVNRITAFAGTKEPPYFITVYDAPVYALTYSKQCQLGLPANYEMVTVEDFIDLMNQMVHPKHWGTLLTYDDFESGFGNYTRGSTADCLYYTGSDLSRLGTHAIDLQDDTGTQASIYHTNGINVHTPGYTHIKVTFWFIADNIETGEDLYVEYYNGSVWQTLTRYIAGTNMENGIFYRKTIDIYEGTYTFPTNMKLRFRSDAGDNYDDFYIDCITVEAQ